MRKCPTEHTNSILRITESQQQRGRRGEGFPRQFPSQHGYSSAMGLLLSCALILPSEKENCRIVCVYFVFPPPRPCTCVCARSPPRSQTANTCVLSSVTDTNNAYCTISLVPLGGQWIYGPSNKWWPPWQRCVCECSGVCAYFYLFSVAVLRSGYMSVENYQNSLN